MTETTPDYAALIERLNALAADAESNDDHGVKEACDKASATLRTLLERNAALERERDLFKELYAKECHARLVERDWLNTRIEALVRERNQLLDKLHCMCGSPIDHSAWEGHTPVSVYDYSLDQERSRAEAAEARVKELEALMHKAHAVMRKCGWQLAISAEPQGDGILEAACTEVEADFADALSAHKLLKENGND